MECLRLPVALRCGGRIRAISSGHLQRTIHVAVPTKQTPFEDDLPSTSLLSVTPSTLNSYALTQPPNPAQLQYAASFFRASPPQLLFSAAYFRDLPPSSFPEVAFLGRSNVGKSSILNALFGRNKFKDAHVSKQPGRTRTMNGFGVTGGAQSGPPPRKRDWETTWKRFPRGGLIVLDMPGYGGGSRRVWGKEAMKFLERRQQLRRTFVLVDAAHGLKATDITLLTHLRRSGINFQIVLSKVDKLLHPGSKPLAAPRLHQALLQLQGLCSKIQQQIDTEVGKGSRFIGDILCCSAEKSIVDLQHQKLGIDELRWAVLSACGLECDDHGHSNRPAVYDMPILDDVG